MPAQCNGQSLDQEVRQVLDLKREAGNPQFRRRVGDCLPVSSFGLRANKVFLYKLAIEHVPKERKNFRRVS